MTATNTGRRAGLDRDDMVAAALALVEAEGVAALTMRRLAAALDVTTNTIYHHVGSRDDLITEIIRTQSERLAARPIEGITTEERVLCAAKHVWDSALDNRAVTSLAHQTGTTALLEHPLEVALARELEAAGLAGDELAQALRSILGTVGGFLVLALRDESSIPEDRRGTALWASTDDDLAPRTIAALARPTDLEALFDKTLRTIVAAQLT
ncbi:MAG: TetR/AcrR family transcriptional regulator [Actinomycetota bacterium]